MIPTLVTAELAHLHQADLRREAARRFGRLPVRYSGGARRSRRR